MTAGADSRRGPAPTAPEDLLDDAGLALLERVGQVVDALGPHTVRTTKSQVAFHRVRGFAYVWPAGRSGDDVPAVLGVALPRAVPSPRWAEVAHPSARTWVHDLALRSVDDVDDEVVAWLREAYEAAD